jgi:hypothetical protein
MQPDWGMLFECLIGAGLVYLGLILLYMVAIEVVRWRKSRKRG